MQRAEAMHIGRPNQWRRYFLLAGSGLLLSLVLFGTTASARAAEQLPAALSKLLGQSPRPTPSQLMEVYRGRLPFENPFWKDSQRGRYGGLHNTTIPPAKTLARMIATLEKAYPGATYAALGRDASVVGDALEAYYGMFGQTQRVTRINASTASFTGRSRDVRDFLTSTTPLRFTDPKRQPGFVLIDRTSYGSDSQSRQVMDAIYEGFALTQQASPDLGRKFGVVSLLERGPAPDKAVIKKRLAAAVADAAKNPGKAPERTLSVRGFSDGPAWHGSWKRFQRQGSRVTTAPGALEREPERKALLWETHELLRLVRTPEFLEAVEEEARKLGIEAPHLAKGASSAVRAGVRSLEESIQAGQRAAEEKAEKAARSLLPSTLRASLDELVASLPKRVAGAGASPSGAKLRAWFSELLHRWPATAELAPEIKRAAGDSFVLPFIEGITAARSEERISKLDYRMMLADAFRIALMRRPVLQALLKLYRTNPTFRQELVDNVANYSSLGNFPATFFGRVSSDLRGVGQPQRLFMAFGAKDLAPFDEETRRRIKDSWY